MAVLPRLEMRVGDLEHRHPDGHRRQADRLIGQGHVAAELRCLHRFEVEDGAPDREAAVEVGNAAGDVMNVERHARGRQ